MNEQKEISEEDYEEYGKGIDSSEQDERDAEEMMAQNDMQLPEPGMGGIYALFGKVMSQKDIKRISNLSKEEMGILPFTVRGSLYVAQLAEQFGHTIFAGFFAHQADIIGETALSKEGFLIQQFITSKKMSSSTQQTSQPIGLPEQQKKKKGWKIFSK